MPSLDLEAVRQRLCEEQGIAVARCLHMWLSSLEQAGQDHQPLRPQTNQEWTTNMEYATISIGVILVVYIIVVVWVVGKQFHKLDNSDADEEVVLLSDEKGHSDLFSMRDVEEDRTSVFL